MAETMAPLRVLVVGASGLVGRACLSLLAHDPRVSQVRVVLRRPWQAADLLGQHASPQALAKLQVVVLDFERLEEHAPQFAVDAVVCALGTTIKQAGSQLAFRRVDHDYPLAVARLAKSQGTRHFLLVSALGAAASSKVFYNRVKGEVEHDIAALGFESFTVARPSLLLGKRAEFRLGERIARQVACLTPPPWTPVHARQVARALVNALHHPAAGQRILQNMAMRQYSAAATGH